MKIWAHTLVRNEERFVWFAVSSVINYVDRILLWDTGSTDNTVELLQKLKKKYASKVDLKLLSAVNPQEFTDTRQRMIGETDSDWIIIVDGDEVWWNDSIQKVTETIRSNNNIESIISPFYNIVGDIFHYQEEKAGNYKIDEYSGHINIRASKNLPGMHFEKPHGQQGLYDKDGVLIQNRDPKKRIFVDGKYMHFTNVARSLGGDASVPKRKLKLKYDLGFDFPPDFYYPEVFFEEKPDIVPSPWIKRSRQFEQRAYIETPLRKLKRRIFPSSVGY